MRIGGRRLHLHRRKSTHRRSEARRIDGDSKLRAFEFVSIGLHFDNEPLAPLRNLDGPHAHTDENLLSGRILDAGKRTVRWTVVLDLRENHPVIANYLKLQRLYGHVDRRHDPCVHTESRQSCWYSREKNASGKDTHERRLVSDLLSNVVTPNGVHVPARNAH